MKIPTNNPIFVENSTDPTNGKIVKEVRRYKEYFKDRQKTTKSFKWDMIWQYFRDRNRKSITQLYRENKGHKLKITYSGDAMQHIIDCPIVPKVDKFEEQLKIDEEKERLRALEEEQNLKN